MEVSTMSKEPDEVLPTYLRDLVSPTPSGFAKLIAAWNGLNSETQMLLLKEVDQLDAPEYLKVKLLKITLKSQNPYVRYLAVKNFYLSVDDSERTEIKQLIENDPDPLVRFCLNEMYLHLGEDPNDINSFFEMPQEARLAVVRFHRGHSIQRGGFIAKLISYAVDYKLKSREVSEIELFEILSDYLNRSEFKEFYKEDRGRRDGYGEYLEAKDLEALWNLVLKVPESISHVLIEHLPPSSGMLPGIPDNVLRNMTDGQLQTLFYRPDIELIKSRKEIFFQSLTGNRVSVRGAAISYNFDLSPAEFAQILSRPEEEKIQIVKDLSFMANDLSLWSYEALDETLSKSGGLFDWEYGEFPRRALERKIQKLNGSKRHRQLTELRLYRLAKQAAHDETDEGYLFDDELKFLDGSVVKGDTLATFMGIWDKWYRTAYDIQDRVERHLPRIYELDEEEPNAEVNTDPARFTDEAFKILDWVINKLRKKEH
jgi:hypothetical protein